MERGFGDLKDGMDEYEIIKRYYVKSDEIENETMIYMKVMWICRQKHERIEKVTVCVVVR